MKIIARFPKCLDEMDNDKEMSKKLLRKLKRARVACESIEYEGRFNALDDAEYLRMIA